MFSCHSESSQNTFSERDGSDEPGNRFESSVHSVFRFADPANVGKSLLDGNKDHVLNQARSELLKQEHQVGSLNNCIEELQQQTYAQRLELEDAHHGYIESRRGQIRNINEMGEMKRAQELRVNEFSVQKIEHETSQRLTSQMQEMQEQMNSMNSSGEFQEVRAVGECVTEKGRLPRTLTVETDVEPACKLWIRQPIAHACRPVDWRQRKDKAPIQETTTGFGVCSRHKKTW